MLNAKHTLRERPSRVVASGNSAICRSRLAASRGNIFSEIFSSVGKVRASQGNLSGKQFVDLALQSGIGRECWPSSQVSPLDQLKVPVPKALTKSWWAMPILRTQPTHPRTHSTHSTQCSRHSLLLRNPLPHQRLMLAIASRCGRTWT